MKQTILFAGILVVVLGFVSFASAQTDISRIQKEGRTPQDEKYTNLESDELQSKGNKTGSDKMTRQRSSGERQAPRRKESQLCRQIYNIYSSINF